MLCSLQGDFSCLFHAQFHCLYILAVGSYHNLEVARFYHVLQICVVELEHIWGDIKAYLLAFTYCRWMRWKPFSSFTGREMLATMSRM